MTPHQIIDALRIHAGRGKDDPMAVGGRYQLFDNAADLLESQQAKLAALDKLDDIITEIQAMNGAKHI